MNSCRQFRKAYVSLHARTVVTAPYASQQGFNLLLTFQSASFQSVLIADVGATSIILEFPVNKSYYSNVKGGDYSYPSNSFSLLHQARCWVSSTGADYFRVEMVRLLTFDFQQPVNHRGQLYQGHVEMEVEKNPTLDEMVLSESSEFFKLYPPTKHPAKQPTS